MRLKGKVAVITGAAQGFGRSIALSFAQEGARLVLADVKEDGIKGVSGEVVAAGAEALAVRANVSDEASILNLKIRPSIASAGLISW